MIAAVTFSGASWWWVALLGAVFLIPLAWLALAPAGRHSRTLAVGLAFRTLGIGLLLICLLDPQWASRRAVRGANAFAVLADNSQGLQVSDAGANTTRGAQLQTRLTGADSAWLAELGDTFQVRPYLFDRDTRRVADFTTLDFTGERSDLVTALRRLRERFAGQPLAGILLFTDGNATDVPEEGADLAGLPPVYPVVVGDGPVRDVRLERVSVRQTAFDDAPVSLQADIAGELAGGTAIQVAVRPVAGGGIAAGDPPPGPQNARLGADGQPASVTFTWRPGGTGIQFYEVVAQAPEGGALANEATSLNNRRVAMVDRGKPAFRILYVGGRPTWDFKFLNRALLDDPQLQMVALLRAARREPKFDFKGRAGEASNPMFRGFGEEEAPRYDEPVLVRINARDAEELRAGFPATKEELYVYDALILDDVEAAFFRQDQLSLLRQFASERGGGLLMLGGADSLDSGGYAETPLAAALPVYLDAAHTRATQVPEGKLQWKLTREGWLEPWVRVRTNEVDERARLGTVPPLYVAHGVTAVKPGATVLAQLEDENETRFPALVAQPFGAGRVAVFTAGDTFRWGLKNETEQADLARFWRQLARWLVTDVPSPVTLRVARDADNASHTRLVVMARDQKFQPVDLAHARLTVRRLDAPAPPSMPAADETAPAPSSTDAPPTAPPNGAERDSGFSSVTMTAEPVPDAPGQFAAVFSGRDAGAYLAEVEVTAQNGAVLGRAQAGWVVDASADEFRSLTPNREFLAEIARRTGGQVVSWDELPGFVRTLPNQDAPVAEAWSYPLWNTAVIFLIVLACFLAEWGWRRWRGLP